MKQTDANVFLLLLLLLLLLDDRLLDARIDGSFSYAVRKTSQPKDETDGNLVLGCLG